MLCNALVLPHADYYSVVWYSCNSRLSQSLEPVQNLGMRVIIDKPPCTPSAPLRKQLGLTALQREIAFQTAMYKFIPRNLGLHGLRCDVLNMVHCVTYEHVRCGTIYSITNELHCKQQKQSHFMNSTGVFMQTDMHSLPSSVITVMTSLGGLYPALFTATICTVYTVNGVRSVTYNSVMFDVSTEKSWFSITCNVIWYIRIGALLSAGSSQDRYRDEELALNSVSVGMLGGPATVQKQTAHCTSP